MQIYLSGFSVPVVCGSVNGQKVDGWKVNGWKVIIYIGKLADEGFHKENIDLSIGADFY